jgi:hypothetical protein
MPAKTGIPAPTRVSRPFDLSVIILPLMLFGFLLARFAAPLFRLLPACTFRQVTGVPCPSCGATRAGLALAQGDLSAALSYNPLWVISLGILFGWSAWRVFEIWGGKSIFSNPSKRMAKIFSTCFKRTDFKMQQRLRWVVISAIVLNWIYLIVAT